MTTTALLPLLPDPLPETQTGIRVVSDPID